ncbi:hypothetical protein F4703DRAFT_1885049 [Phycomyces blakesleeanus]
MKDSSAIEKRLEDLSQYRLRLNRELEQPSILNELDSTILSTSNEYEERRKQADMAKTKAAAGLRNFVLECALFNKKSQNEVEDNMKAVLKSYAETIMTKHAEDSKALENAISAVELGKASAGDVEKLATSIKEMEDKLKAQQAAKMEELRLQNKEAFQKLNTDYEKTTKEWENLKALEKDSPLLNGISKKVFQTLQEENRSLFQPSVEPIDPARVQQLIADSAEIKSLKAQLEQVKLSAQTETSKNAMRVQIEQRDEIIRGLTVQLADVKTKQESTQAFINAIRSQDSKHNSVNIDHARVESAIKRVDELSKDMNLVQNKILSMDTMANVRQREMQRLSEKIEYDGVRPGNENRKRRRVFNEDSSTSDVTDKRTKDLETKLDQLTDYVYQFRSTVLSSSFPTELETSLNDIEQILKNHEYFIAYLVDPVAASKGLEISEVPRKSAINGTDPSNLSPAMLEAINKTVEESVTEATRPLLQTIRDLQERLDNQN